MTDTGSTTVRVSRDVHRRLKALAEEEGDTLSEVVDRLLEERRREQFFRRTNEGFDRLRRRRDEGAQYDAETEELAGASNDGLEAHPYDG
jgi:predicted transcriptional regulator